MELSELVKVFATAIESADGICPQYVTRSGRQYRPGIGPYPENKAMELVVADLRRNNIECGQFVAYPLAARQKCDLWIGSPREWLVEVKMGRFRGDNGKPDDTGIKDLLSPFRSDRSAFTDAIKLAASGFSSRKALLVYGFDDPERPLPDALDALEVLLRSRVTVSDRCEQPFADLRHPVFASGTITAWEVNP